MALDAPGHAYPLEVGALAPARPVQSMLAMQEPFPDSASAYRTAAGWGLGWLALGGLLLVMILALHSMARHDPMPPPHA